MKWNAGLASGEAPPVLVVGGTTLWPADVSIKTFAGGGGVQLRLFTSCSLTTRAASRHRWPRRVAIRADRAPQAAAPVFPFILAVTVQSV